MPYEIRQRDGKHCVYKKSGELVKCHDSEQDAKDHMAALYANVPDAKAVKFADGSEVDVEGYLAPYGGPFNGRDITQEFFSAKTDFVLNWFEGDRPLLYHHGLDAKTGLSVVGRIKGVNRDDLGLWMQAQLDAHHEYYDAIKDLIKQGKLGLSSGSMRHLVQVDAKSGEILRWPLIEGSLTPTPANPFAEVDFAEAKSHYKAIGIDLPEEAVGLKLASSDMPEMAATGHKPVSKKRMREMASEMVSEMDMDMSDSEMDAMMAEMGDMAGMDEGQAREKMRRTLRRKAGKAADLMTFVLSNESDLPEVLASTPLAIHGEVVNILATTLLERTKDLHERRIKEGRVLSTGNRKRLGDCLSAMRDACERLDALLSATEPPAKAASDVLLRLELLKLQAGELLN